MSNTLTSFGLLLRRYRTAAGLTQEELAEQAGLSARGISDLERGERERPHRDTVADACRRAWIEWRGSRDLRDRGAASLACGCPGRANVPFPQQSSHATNPADRAGGGCRSGGAIARAGGSPARQSYRAGWGGENPPRIASGDRHLLRFPRWCLLHCTGGDPRSCPYYPDGWANARGAGCERSTARRARHAILAAKTRAPRPRQL